MKAWGLLPVLLGFCAPDETISGYADREATWRLTHLGDAAFTAKATISFPDKGAVLGAGPCNSFRATQGVPYPWIEIGQIAATRRACPELDLEQQYFAALRSATLAEVSGTVLILTAEDGIELVFERISP